MLLNNIEQIEFERYTQVYDFSDYFNNKTFLITGSKGIVGSGLTRWLLFENSRKNCNTRIILSSRTPEKIPDYIEKGDNVTFCKFG